MDIRFFDTDKEQVELGNLVPIDDEPVDEAFDDENKDEMKKESSSDDSSEDKKKKEEEERLAREKAEEERLRKEEEERIKKEQEYDRQATEAYRILSKLSPIQRKRFLENVVFNKSTVEIAAKEGVAQPSVYQSIESAKEKIEKLKN